MKMTRIRGFTTFDFVMYMALAAMFLGMATLGWKTWISRGDLTVMRDQAKSTQAALEAWVGEQRTLAAAAAQFQPGSDGDLVPRSLSALVAALNEYFQEDGFHLKESGGVVVTDVMEPRSAYMEIYWPQPYRQSYPHVRLVMPEE